MLEGGSKEHLIPAFKGFADQVGREMSQIKCRVKQVRMPKKSANGGGSVEQRALITWRGWRGACQAGGTWEAPPVASVRSPHQRPVSVGKQLVLPALPTESSPRSKQCGSVQKSWWLMKALLCIVP